MKGITFLIAMAITIMSACTQAQLDTFLDNTLPQHVHDACTTQSDLEKFVKLRGSLSYGNLLELDNVHPETGYKEFDLAYDVCHRGLITWEALENYYVYPGGYHYNKGTDRQGYLRNGHHHATNLHKDTGTEFNPSGIHYDTGTAYDREGYDSGGWERYLGMNRQLNKHKHSIAPNKDIAPYSNHTILKQVYGTNGKTNVCFKQDLGNSKFEYKKYDFAVNNYAIAIPNETTGHTIYVDETLEFTHSWGGWGSRYNQYVSPPRNTLVGLTTGVTERAHMLVYSKGEFAFPESVAFYYSIYPRYSGGRPIYFDMNLNLLPQRYISDTFKVIPATVVNCSEFPTE